MTVKSEGIFLNKEVLSFIERGDVGDDEGQYHV